MLTEEQIKARKAYINLLIEKAKEKALVSPDNLLIDPQGRILIDVALPEDALEQFKAGFVGDIKPSKVTTVSLDVTKDPDLQALKDAYMEKYGLDDTALQQLSTVQSSIIPLQQEYHFHLALAARTYGKVFEKQTGDKLKKKLEKEAGISELESQLKKAIDTKIDAGTYNREEFKEEFKDLLEQIKTVKREINKKFTPQFKAEQKIIQMQMAEAHQKAMERVQVLVEGAFKKALAKASKGNTLDEAKLIKELDKARKGISAEAHGILMEEVVRATGKRLSRKDLKQADVLHLAESTTATPNDLLHTDGSSKLATWISGSENTAHERGVDTLADRQIATIALKEGGYTPSRLQIRTPSLDVKKDIEKPAAINDVSVKLLTIAAKYSLDKVVTDKPEIGKAFTYNLHTAINDTLGDINGNKQSAGARIILSGAHLYNKSQLDSVNPKPFCLVQNISINGFGDTLGYGGNSLRTEATLMAEMAMLYNLVGEDDIQRNMVKEVFDKYREFLGEANAHPTDDLFFSASPQGKEAIALIQDIKKGWESQQLGAEAVNPVESAKAALKKMMANNLHHQHEYSKLIQALSIFVEEASIAGCKSGNERAQAINGRVAIFDHEAGNLEESEIFATMNLLAVSEGETVINETEKLKRLMDEQYDKRLQSGVSLISDVDQGASAKVNARKTLDGVSWYAVPFVAIVNFFSNQSRNIAEESSLQNLSQGKAGKMQAHKGLTKQMADSWEPKSLGSYLGKVGIFLSVITAGVGFFLVGLPAYAVYKSKTNAQIEPKIQAAMKDYQSAHQEEVNPVTCNGGPQTLVGTLNVSGQSIGKGDVFGFTPPPPPKTDSPSQGVELLEEITNDTTPTYQ
ncbi:hypothetical protein [Fluoribacter dumoffii]|uniref:Uncharacterized protein n=1 Tax=Fluoribacter dumoffii TaxID=463 RepID=A0A377GEE6_9GAMM|nr:hypothetical protein [Fluoribacter dumoffii]KTC91461.1 hypothetical protein Ldum_2529 [Fluoribacter dumoffii NY 23]STO23165.1 Uncharacterised protein [Fluoribacter dumoffii]